jgi:hypothetical protein
MSCINIHTLADMVHVINHLNVLANNQVVVPGRDMNKVQAVITNFNKTFVSECYELDVNSLKKLEGGEKTLNQADVLSVLNNIQSLVQDIYLALDASPPEEDENPEAQNPFEGVLNELKARPDLKAAVEEAKIDMTRFSGVSGTVGPTGPMFVDDSREARKKRLESETQKLEEAEPDFAVSLKKAKEEVQERVIKTRIKKDK